MYILHSMYIYNHTTIHIYTLWYRIVLPAAEEGSDAVVENEWMTALLRVCIYTYIVSAYIYVRVHT